MSVSRGARVSADVRGAGRLGLQDAGSLTGARVVLEGAHAVSVGRERAHALAGVCQPALDRPVGAARVHVLVYQLRRGTGRGYGWPRTQRAGSEAPPNLSV